MCSRRDCLVRRENRPANHIGQIAVRLVFVPGKRDGHRRLHTRNELANPRRFGLILEPLQTPHRPALSLARLFERLARSNGCVHRGPLT